MALRLLNLWPWGCTTDFLQIPSQGTFWFQPANQNYWLESNLGAAMKWYYKVKTWKLEANLLVNGQEVFEDPLTATGGFGSPKDVVCGRAGLNLLTPAAGIPNTASTFSAGLYLFSDFPNDPLISANLEKRHSVVFNRFTNNFRTFCFVYVTFQGFGSGGAAAIRQTNILQHRFEFQLYFDNEEVLEAESSFVGYQYLIRISPSEFFDFAE